MTVLYELRGPELVCKTSSFLACFLPKIEDLRAIRGPAVSDTGARLVSDELRTMIARDPHFVLDCFKTFDENEDGTIQLAELKVGLESLGLKRAIRLNRPFRKLELAGYFDTVLCSPDNRGGMTRRYLEITR